MKIIQDSPRIFAIAWFSLTGILPYFCAAYVPEWVFARPMLPRDKTFLLWVPLLLGGLIGGLFGYRVISTVLSQSGFFSYLKSFGISTVAYYLIFAISISSWALAGGGEHSKNATSVFSNFGYHLLWIASPLAIVMGVLFGSIFFLLAKF